MYRNILKELSSVDRTIGLMNACIYYYGPIYFGVFIVGLFLEHGSYGLILNYVLYLIAVLGYCSIFSIDLLCSREKANN